MALAQSEDGEPDGDDGTPGREDGWPEGPVSAGWSADDLLMLTQLYVDQMIATGCLFLEAPASAGTPVTTSEPGPGDRARQRVALTAARRLRLISIGRLHWLDRPADEGTSGRGPAGCG